MPKLVRIGGRGAVAVVAASWRVAASLTTQQHYLNALRASATIGEAMVEAKRRIRTPDLVELFNLLGRWAPDEATRRKILVDNPARLFRF